jgi:hypothetical protein
MKIRMPPAYLKLAVMINTTLNDKERQNFLLGLNLSFEKRFYFYTH